MSGGSASKLLARALRFKKKNVPTIELAAGARIVQAPGLPPAPAPGACRAALQDEPGTVRNLWQSLRAAQAPGASIARGHIYLAPGTTVAVVARALRTPQSPPVRYTSTAISEIFY